MSKKDSYFKAEGIGSVDFSYDADGCEITINDFIAERHAGVMLFKVFNDFVLKHYKVDVMLLTASDAYEVPVESLVRFYGVLGFVPYDTIKLNSDGTRSVNMVKNYKAV